MHIFSILKRVNFLIIILFFMFCEEPINPFDNIDNVKVTVTIPPRTDSYLWAIGDSVLANITVSYLSLVDSIHVFYGEGDTILSNDTILSVTSDQQDDTTLQLLHIFSTIGQKTVNVFVYLSDNKTCLNDSDTVNIGIKPSIDTLISSGDAAVGLPYFMYVKASGSPTLTFSWYKNGSVLPQDTCDTLHFNPLLLSDSGSYYCVVKNSWGSITSSTVNLAVAPRFSVTYDGNNATGGMVPTDSAFYKTGDMVTVLGNTGSLVKTGCTFTGWNTRVDGTGTSYAGGDTFTMDTADVVLYAKWTTNPTYTVTYDDNGSSSGSVPVDANNYESGATVTVLGNTGNLAKTGHTFAGWNTKADGTGTNYAGGDTFTMDTAEVVLYAKWTTNLTYTVTYDDNGSSSGFVPVDANNYESGATVTVLGNTGNLSKTGHTFAGWNTKADGTGTSYAGGDTFTMDTADVVLYARWTTNPTYIVTYNGNGSTSGSVPVDANNYESGATVTVHGNTGSLAKTGHTFAGWNTEADGTGTSYAGGDTFTMDTADVLLYAKWTINSYIVRFNSNGGSPVDSQIVLYNTTATEPTPPTRNGYIFAGWYSDQALTVPFVFTIPITASITLYAKWTPVYTVTYNGNTNTGGTIPVDTNKYTNGTSVTVLDNTGSLVKNGYTFSKWNTNASGTGVDRTPGETFTMGSANVILFAKWAINQYTVTFNSQGGTSVPSQQVNHGSHATQPASPTRSGYFFDGWYKDSMCTDIWNFTSNVVTADVTLYAKWVIKDADGNIYTEITIGTQTWMVENLRTTKYNDGNDIPLVTDSAAWANLTTPGYCWYNNDINNKTPYGALYNWYTVNSGKLAPDGWHVPDTTDWNILEKYLVANGYNWDGTTDTTAYNKIAKSLASKTGWDTSSNPGAIGNDLTKNNTSGFSAYPGGCRYYLGNYPSSCVMGKYSYWWTATEYVSERAYHRYLEYQYDYLNNSSGWSQGCGFSVRLVRNAFAQSK